MTLDRGYPNFATYFRRTGRTQIEVAAELDISQSLVSRIKTRVIEPPLWLALEIYRRYGVALESMVVKRSAHRV